MWDLVPTELHQYSLADLARGFVSAVRSGRGQGPAWPAALGEAIPVRSARAAIVLALKALGLPPGAGVGVPLYCCPVVFKAITTAGCRPRFLDVEAETFGLSPDDVYAKRRDLDAVIAVHMFGNLCEAGTLQGLLEGRPVIEDCAQALGSTLGGRWAGSIGTIGVYSFRLGKYLSAGEGAAISAGSTKLRGDLAGLVAALPQPSLAGEVKHLAETFVRAKLRSRPLWGLIGDPIWRAYNARTEFTDKSPIVVSRMFRSDLGTVKRRLRALDRMIEAQRKNAAFYLDNLNAARAMFCWEKPGRSYNRFMFPVIFGSTAERDAMRAALAKKSISSATPYAEAIDGAARNYGYGGDCPVAERLLRTTLVIPSHHRLSRRDVDRIARSFNAAWARIKAA